MRVDTPYQLLIVEDDLDTSTMLQEFFDRQGYQVRVTAWGEEAIAQCRKAPPDLILLDVRLPDMDGYEVYARLRQNLREQHVPAIFMTERRSRDARLTGLELGAVDYITKPFDLEELSLRVRNALQLY
jgi:DNA-binding response OmpR family regulator